MEWTNEGIEPSETLKNQGFKGGYKPPAEVFNYFLHNSEICIDELQKATDKSQNTADSAKTAATKAQSTADSANAAADKAQSTADSAKTAADKAQSTADNAKSAADKAQSTADDAKAVADEAQRTAEGKADGTHKHKKSDITDFPTSMTPTSHASQSTTYGAGNGSYYGHVKLSDSTTSSSGVSGGIAATPAAVKSVKAIADTAKSTADSAQAAADKAQNTASSAAMVANSAQSTAENAGATAVSAQTAAAEAQSTADNAKSVADKAQSTADDAKAVADEAQSTAEGKADGTHKHKKSDITDFPTSMTPTSHASQSTTYGAGNGSYYGHVKLSDSTTSSSGVSGGIAATPAAVNSVRATVDDLETEVNSHAITKAKTGKLTFTDSTTTYSVTCGFKPRFIKIYHLDNLSGTVLIYNEKILYAAYITKVTVTSTGFTITKSSIGTTADVCWEAYA